MAKEDMLFPHSMSVETPTVPMQAMAAAAPTPTPPPPPPPSSSGEPKAERIDTHNIVLKCNRETMSFGISIKKMIDDTGQEVIVVPSVDPTGVNAGDGADLIKGGDEIIRVGTLRVGGNYQGGDEVTIRVEGEGLHLRPGGKACSSDLGPGFQAAGRPAAGADAVASKVALEVADLLTRAAASYVRGAGRLPSSSIL